MTIDQLGSIGEFSSAILLFVSLIYIGFQIRQNTNATRAQIYQARSDAKQAYNLFIAGSDGVLEVVGKIGVGEIDFARIATLTDLEIRRLTMVQIAYRSRVDNMFYQYQNGFIDKEFYQESIEHVIRAFGPLWRILNITEGRSSFLNEIDRIVENRNY